MFQWMVLRPEKLWAGARCFSIKPEENNLVGRSGYQDLIINHVHLAKVSNTELLHEVILIITNVNEECLSLSKEAVNFLICFIEETMVREIKRVTIHLYFNRWSHYLILRNVKNELPKCLSCVVKETNEDLLVINKAGVDQWICKSKKCSCRVIYS